MSKIRIYKLAEELGVDGSVIIEKLKEYNIQAATHFNSIDGTVAEKIREDFDESDNKSKKTSSKNKEDSKSAKKVDKVASKDKKDDKKLDKARENLSKEDKLKDEKSSKNKQDEQNKFENIEKTEKLEKTAKSEKIVKAEKLEETDKNSDKSKKTKKTKKSKKVEKVEKEKSEEKLQEENKTSKVQKKSKETKAVKESKAEKVEIKSDEDKSSKAKKTKSKKSKVEKVDVSEMTDNEKEKDGNKKSTSKDKKQNSDKKQEKASSKKKSSFKKLEFVNEDNSSSVDLEDFEYEEEDFLEDIEDIDDDIDFVDLIEDEKFEKIPKKSGKKIDLDAIELEEFHKKERQVKKSKSAKKKKRGHYNQEHQAAQKAQESCSTIQIGEMVTVSDLANALKQPATQLIMKLFQLGIMATVNEEIDFETAELLAADFDCVIEKEKIIDDVELFNLDYEDDPKSLKKRAPVVTVMGHVDHGKTSLLDAIRSSNVIDAEAGGITQHIGASEIEHNGEKIVFLDTPGHEAFTSLRARGAKVTDIAILVVAADDGVMPQTIEAIDHSKAAGVPIIVAINKIDKPGANPDRVKQELSEYGVLIEEWGGDVICVHVSALKKEGIDQLLEMVLLVAEMEELKANPDRPAVGTIIEAKVDKGRGTLITVLIEKGKIKIGDSVFAGTTYGRVRAMYNHLGKQVKSCGPASAVEIMGMNEVPQAGEKLYVVDDDRLARTIAQRRATEQRQDDLKMNTHVTLEDLFSQIQSGEVKDLNIILKADVHGSVEALRGSLMKLSNDEVKINLIHANVGTVTESDILLASASNAIIIGFNVRPSSAVKLLAERENVEMKTYRIIYNAIDDIEKAMKGMLSPEYKEVILGHIEVRETFKVPNVGVIAGGYVKEGKVQRNAQIRLSRDGIIIHEGKIDSLRRFKDDVKEVSSGYECGIGIENYNDIKNGDIIEAFVIEEIARV